MYNFLHGHRGVLHRRKHNKKTASGSRFHLGSTPHFVKPLVNRLFSPATFAAASAFVAVPEREASEGRGPLRCGDLRLGHQGRGKRALHELLRGEILVLLRWRCWVRLILPLLLCYFVPLSSIVRGCATKNSSAVHCRLYAASPKVSKMQTYTKGNGYYSRKCVSSLPGYYS